MDNRLQDCAVSCLISFPLRAREHQLEGIAKAKAAGVYKGRPSAFFFVPSCGLTEWPSVRVASLRRFRPTSAGGGNAQSPSRRERRAVAPRASSQ